jgi:tetratricopeptide (TPR) repeat protein
MSIRIGCTQSAERLRDLQEHGDEAVREYSAALANLPASPAEGSLYGIQLHMDLMEIYRNQGDENAAHNQLQIAQSEINKLNDQTSGRAQFLRLRALIKMSAEDPGGALADVKEALAINSP